MDEEAVIVGGTNHSHATKDLYDAIEAGDYPEWTLAIQTMNPEDEDKVEKPFGVGGGGRLSTTGTFFF